VEDTVFSLQVNIIMNIQLDRFVVATRKDDSTYDLEDRTADSLLKDACAPSEFKESTRPTFAASSARRNVIRTDGWLNVADNADENLGRLLIEDVKKLGTSSTPIVVLISKSNQLFASTLSAIQGKSVEKYPFEICRKKKEYFLQFPATILQNSIVNLLDLSNASIVAANTALSHRASQYQQITY
jgi:hypothetical protein